jgi:AcrR family transcriptional regulator
MRSLDRVMNDTSTAEPRGTRERIKHVALELFTEHGYEQTSLREIAEQLGVTKAALYYHFKSKEELLESFLTDRFAELDAHTAWLKEQPRTREVRREFIRRYSTTVYSAQHHKVMRFLETNQAALKETSIGAKMRDRMRTLLDALVDRDEPLSDQLRVALGLWALHTSWFILDPAIPDGERQAAATEVALELVS